ncbi:RNA polymerase subunit sigma-70 [Alsobacter sp. KACC 23698]|uniref:RNA polymerase subunit sigma-70 n=1 Tax=Alsobacter sp. KACC 23698 TaxID=3149229 RepID=A0AAU7JM04_9HYPH
MTADALSRNVRRLGHLDLPGGGQVIFDGKGHAIVGHMKPPYGTTILDVSNPSRPTVVSEIRLDDDQSHTHKVRVAGDIMITNVEENERHAKRRAGRLKALEAEWAARHGRPATDAELAAALKVKPEAIPGLRRIQPQPYEQGGFKIWDIADRSRPRLLAYQRTFGFGVHRFDMDERYAYISTEMEGYRGNILVIYDISNPEKPEEVSRWHLPGQHVAAGETPTWSGESHRLHHALRQGDDLWAAVWYAGVRRIDVTDIARPRTVGAFNYHPPTPEPTHTVLPAKGLIGGRRIAVAVDEEHDHTPGQPHAHLWIFDVTEGDFRPLSTFHVSDLDSPYARLGRFGAHQFQEHIDGSLVYCAWFSGGLRVVDISNPEEPSEVGRYIPEPVGGNASPQTNDVDVDADGLIAIIDRNSGFDLLVHEG